MAVLLTCSGLRKSFGARTIFTDLSFTISDGDRCRTDRAEWQRQDYIAGNSGRERSPGRRRTCAAQADAAGLCPAGFGVRAGRYGWVRARRRPHLAAPGARGEEARIQSMLGRAGFADPKVRQPRFRADGRSGSPSRAPWWLRRTCCLLDEPTNHLDLEGILWLERAIAARRTPAWWSATTGTSWKTWPRVWSKSIRAIRGTRFSVKGITANFWRSGRSSSGPGQAAGGAGQPGAPGGGVAAPRAESPNRQIQSADRRRRTPDRGAVRRRRRAAGPAPRGSISPPPTGRRSG